MGGRRERNMETTRTRAPEDSKKTTMRHAKDDFRQRWAKTHEAGELNEGVWFEPVEALLKKKSPSTAARQGLQHKQGCGSSVALEAEVYEEHIVGNLSLEVVGAIRLADRSFSRRLGACAGSSELSSGIGPSL